MFKRSLLSLEWVLTAGLIVGLSTPTIAAPDEMFAPHLDRIRSSLPSGFEMRLPAEVILGDAIPLETEELIVRVFSTASPPRLTIGLFTCESSPFPCLIGSFAVESTASTNAQRELNRHRSMVTPITLAQGIEGYYLEGTAQTPPSAFSSVMWQQNQMIYTVSFQAHERQNILNMAASMANEPPVQQ